MLYRTQIEAFCHDLPNKNRNASYWLGRSQKEPCQIATRQHGPAVDLLLNFDNASIRLATGSAPEIEQRLQELECLKEMFA